MLVDKGVSGGVETWKNITGQTFISIRKTIVKSVDYRGMPI